MSASAASLPVATRATPEHRGRRLSGVTRAAPPPRPVRVRPRVVLALISLAAVLAGLGWLGVELGGHPISSVRIAAEFRHLDRGELEAAIEPHLGNSFFGVDVDAVRRAASTLPWVREASVRRVWPGSIHIAIVEREAAYRWGDKGLLEADGTLFTPTTREGFDDLPLLSGPDDAHAQVVALYGELTALLTPIGQRLRSLEQNARGAWRAQLSGGIELILGREPGHAALNRLARAFPAVLAGQQERIEAIDLRYANGFAVRWKTPPAATTASPESHG